jgi:hypothetical protein
MREALLLTGRPNYIVVMPDIETTSRKSSLISAYSRTDKAIDIFPTINSKGFLHM